ncbi:MAG TPA: type VI secretion system baseplate subunit TssF [Polyangiales bacterium]|nr:type VI secretion system baseplate subunit TssF [Polyangiales bacterium]
MFNKYYQSELSYLRELGQEFAATHPELADVFAAKGGDPDVERLLEGFSFLTARLRARVDDAVPELVESLAQLAFPHYVRTLPSSAIVEFTPSTQALRSRHAVPAGTELGARPISGTSCAFRTTVDLELLPLEVERVSLDESSARSTVLRLALRTTEAGRAAVFHESGVRLHFAGPVAQASTLFFWFLRHLKSVQYRGQGLERELGDGKVEACSLAAGGALLPWPALGMDAPRVLQEYFLLPEALLFVDVHGLERISPDEASDRFELAFRFEEPPSLPERLSNEHVRLNCVPVINLFETSADPIPLDRRTHEYLLRASGIDPHHMEIYEVHDVTGVRENHRERVRYTRFFSFEHATRPRDEQSYFTIRRALSPIDSGLDTYLSVMTPRDVPPQMAGETLSIALTCTNRMLAANLRAGDICMPTPRSPTVARFRNITGVTPPIQPPLGDELYWRLLAHLAINQRSLGEGDNLRALCALYCFEGDQQQARANRARAGSIRGVKMSLARRVVQDLVLRGIRSEVAIDETQFASVGDAFVFGCALDALFAALCPLNSFHQLQLQLHPSLADMPWPPRNGTKSPF